MPTHDYNPSGITKVDEGEGRIWFGVYDERLSEMWGFLDLRLTNPDNNANYIGALGGSAYLYRLKRDKDIQVRVVYYNGRVASMAFVNMNPLRKRKTIVFVNQGFCPPHFMPSAK